MLLSYPNAGIGSVVWGGSTGGLSLSVEGGLSLLVVGGLSLIVVGGLSFIVVGGLSFIVVSPFARVGLFGVELH